MKIQCPCRRPRSWLPDCGAQCVGAQTRTHTRSHCTPQDDGGDDDEESDGNFEVEDDQYLKKLQVRGGNGIVKEEGHEYWILQQVSMRFGLVAV